MTYAYFNNGLSFRAVLSDYTAQPGEVLFSALATSGELTSAFAGYTAAIAAEALAALVQSAQSALNYSTLVGVQCFKSGVSWPSAWNTYDTALQNIINGTDTTSTSLPSLPTMPSGLPSSFPAPSQTVSLV